ncbi:MAG: transcription termination factor NusA [Lachnospiraceae bacterium]|nr:transcription termination factor NusA [Lachnospiraceae bacterium]
MSGGSNLEMMEAIALLEKEKDISRDVLFDAIENSLITACEKHFGGKNENVHVNLDRTTGIYVLFAEKTVVDEVMDSATEISLEDAKNIDPAAEIGGIVRENIRSDGFGRIVTQAAKSVIIQKLKEEERTAVFNRFNGKSHDVVTGTVQRINGKNISINLGKADALLSENEQVPSEHLRPTDRVKVYILDVKNSPRGPKIIVSRTHPELVKCLFENEVAEVSDGTVEIRSISREAGSRTKIAVYSNNPDVDAVGACVGLNGARVNSIVDELKGEKIDIVNWDENPAIYIENALSPAKVVSVIVDGDEKTAKVVVPDYQLSLAIGKEGQNARLAAKLTGFKIDIKSETQAKDAPGFRMEDYLDLEDEEYYEEGEYEEGEYYEGEGVAEEYEEAPADEQYEDYEEAAEPNEEETSDAE